MIDLTMGPHDPLDRIVEQLQTLQDPDLMPLALDLKEIIIRENQNGLLQGLDADGVPFAPLADATYARGRGGLGPPLIPRFRASQLIDRFRVDISASSAGGIRISAGWPGVPQVKLFKTGTREMPARNPAGIRPATRARIMQAVADFKKQLVAKF